MRQQVLLRNVANLLKRLWVHKMTKKLLVTLNKSLTGRLPKHIACARGLGLSKIRQSVVVQDTPENRGMVNKINYLVSFEEKQ